MDNAGMVVIIPITIALTVLLVRWKNGRTRKFITNYLAEHQIDAEIADGWMPPLRHWLKNRKGDSWCRVKFANEEFRWVRVRKTLFSGTQVEFFE